MANCIQCGKSCEQEKVLFVMEWSDNVVGSRQIQQSGIRGAVKASICPECMRTYVA